MFDVHWRAPPQENKGYVLSMINKKILVACLLACLSAVSMAKGDTLFGYFTEGSADTSNTANLDDKFTAHNIVPNGGAQVGSLWRYSYQAAGTSNDFTYSGDVGAAPSDAFSVSVGCKEGYQVQLETLSFKIAHEVIQKGGFDAETRANEFQQRLGMIALPSVQINLYAMLDGVETKVSSTMSEFSLFYFSAGANYDVSFDLSSYTFSKDATFRVEYSLLNDSTSTVDFDGRFNMSDVILTGKTSKVVPESSSALLWFAGVGLCSLRRKRR